MKAEIWTTQPFTDNLPTRSVSPTPSPHIRLVSEPTPSRSQRGCRVCPAGSRWDAGLLPPGCHQPPSTARPACAKGRAQAPTEQAAVVPAALRSSLAPRKPPCRLRSRTQPGRLAGWEGAVGPGATASSSSCASRIDQGGWARSGALVAR